MAHWPLSMLVHLAIGAPAHNAMVIGMSEFVVFKQDLKYRIHHLAPTVSDQIFGGTSPVTGFSNGVLDIVRELPESQHHNNRTKTLYHTQRI